MAPLSFSFGEFFTDFGNHGWETSFREFLGYFVKQFYPGIRTQLDKLPYTRLDYPLLVFPFFLAAIITLWEFWVRPSKARGVAAGAAAGLLFYVYFNAWVYWLIVIGCLAIYTIVFERHDRKRLVAFVVLLGALGVVAVPFLVNYLRFTVAPGTDDFIQRQWLAEGRVIAWRALGYAYLVYAALAFVVHRVFWQRDRRKAAILLAGVAAMPIVWNIQLLTGFVPAPDHWKRIVSPMIYLTVAVILHELARRAGEHRPIVRFAVLALLVALLFLATTKKMVNALALTNGLDPPVAAKHAFPQELVDSWNWMNANLPGEPKVLSPSSMTSLYLAVYTGTRPYLPYGILTPRPTAEIEERFLAASKLFGVPEDTLRAELGDLGKIPPICTTNECFDMFLNFSKTPFNLYACYFTKGSFNAVLYQPCAVPADYREALVLRYRETRADWDARDAEYVYVGPHERQLAQGNFKPDDRLQRVYENPLVEIYRIKPE